jgi:hypothetical protein
MSQEFDPPLFKAKAPPGTPIQGRQETIPPSGELRFRPR